MQVSRIRLSDKTSRLHPRHAAPKRAQAHEPEVPAGDKSDANRSQSWPDELTWRLADNENSEAARLGAQIDKFRAARPTFRPEQPTGEARALKGIGAALGATPELDVARDYD